MDSYQDQAAETGSEMSRNVAVPSVGATSALTSQQAKAIELIAEGMTVTACAEAVGATRRTLQRWFKDAVFQAAYNAWRAEVQAEARGRLLTLLGPAVTVVAKRLEAGDLKAAALLLKGLGFLQPVPPGLDDPKTIALRQRAAKEKEEMDAILGSLP